MYGFTRDEVIGTTLDGRLPSAMVGGTHANACALPCRQGARDRDHDPAQERRAFDVELRYLPIVHLGEPHVLAIARDITERRAAEVRARAARGAAAPGAEDGGHRPAHRRHRARLQQHPDQRHRLPGAGPGTGRYAGRCPAAAPAGPGAPRRAAGARADRADAGLCAAPAWRAPHPGAGAAGQPGAATAARHAAVVGVAGLRCAARVRRRRPARGRRRGAAGTGAVQPVHQRARRDHRAGLDPGASGPPRRRLVLRVVPRTRRRRPLGRAERGRQRQRHRAGPARPHLRALHLQQGGRPRLGHGPGDGARHRARPWRPRARRDHGRVPARCSACCCRRPAARQRPRPTRRRRRAGRRAVLRPRDGGRRRSHGRRLHGRTAVRLGHRGGAAARRCRRWPGWRTRTSRSTC